MFTCYDPFKYGDSQTVSGLQVTNAGNEDTPCTIRVTFSAARNGFQIRNVQADKQTRIILNFAIGDNLVIDMDRRIIRVNNQIRMPIFDFRSEMFQLVPGVNTYQTNVPAGNIETIFAPRWR